MIYLILIQLSLCWSHPHQQNVSKVASIENLDRLTITSKPSVQHIEKPSNLGDNFKAITISQDKRRKRQELPELNVTGFDPDESTETTPSISTDSGKATGPASKVAWLYLLIPIACVTLFIVFTMPLIKTTPSPPPVEQPIQSDPGLISPSGGLTGAPGGPTSAEAMKTVSEPKLGMPPPPVPGMAAARPLAPAIRPMAAAPGGLTPPRMSKSFAKVVTGKGKGPTPKS